MQELLMRDIKIHYYYIRLLLLQVFGMPIDRIVVVALVVVPCKWPSETPLSASGASLRRRDVIQEGA